jgi:hypothetical protein
MAFHIIERLLQHTIHLHASGTVHRKRRARFFVVQLQTGLPLNHRNIPIERALQALFIEQHRMQRLRQAANIVQRRLRDFANLLQILAERRALGHLLFHPAQQRANRRQHLAEFVVQLAGNVAKRGLLRGNQFLRQIAALLGESREPREDLPVRTNQVQAGERDGDERRG